MGRPRRRLLRNEHRIFYPSGARIVKFKTNRWKKNKTFDRSQRLWIKKSDYIDKSFKPEVEREVKALKFHRYSLIKIWSVSDDENYYPQLEIKVFQYARRKLNKEQVRKHLNNILQKVKSNYDFADFFSNDITLTRRRIAFESQQIHISEYNSEATFGSCFSFTTVNNSVSSIRSGFPRRENHRSI